MLIQCMLIGWSSQVSMGCLALSFRRWDYSSILCFAVCPFHKYRSEPSLYFYSLCFKSYKKKKEIFVFTCMPCEH